MPLRMLLGFSQDVRVQSGDLQLLAAAGKEGVGQGD